MFLENHQQYSNVLADRMQRGGQFVSVTTACGFHGRPQIWASVIVCSINAVTPEEFDQHIGIAGGLDRVVENIRWILAEHGTVEIHSLQWEGNPDPDERLLELFGDSHARIRVSEKVENQCGVLGAGPHDRIPCDYLNGITISPDGRLRQCAHDFFSTEILGHYEDIPAALVRRDVIRNHHRQKQYYGICENCNYNTATPGKIRWIK